MRIEDLTLGNKQYKMRTGFLHTHATWDTNFAIHTAYNEGITLTKAHWEFINFLLDHYKTTKRNPVEKALVNMISRGLGKDKGSSVYLRSLFPKGGDQLALISGLRKPGLCPYL